MSPDHLRVMVVDDSPINLKLFCRLLAMEGFTNVETASHGLECVERLMIYREQALNRFKKYMEAKQSKGEQQATEGPLVMEEEEKGQQQATRTHTDEEADDLTSVCALSVFTLVTEEDQRRRISNEAHVITQALLQEVGSKRRNKAKDASHTQDDSNLSLLSLTLRVMAALLLVVFVVVVCVSSWVLPALSMRLCRSVSAWPCWRKRPASSDPLKKENKRWSDTHRWRAWTWE